MAKKRWTKSDTNMMIVALSDQGFTFIEQSNGEWLAVFNPTGHQSMKGTLKEVIYWADGFLTK